MQNKVMLNLGCGKAKLDGWINVDFHAIVKPDEVVDLNIFPWPWADGTIDVIHMSHILEHLDDTCRVLAECNRILKANGLIDIRVPHVSHDLALGDRCHRRIINAYTFSKGSFTSGEDILDRSGNLRMVKKKILFDKEFTWMVHAPKWMKNFAINHLRNVARESQFMLMKTEYKIALTFDDGPSEYTMDLLDELDIVGIKVAFFMLGENVRKFPDVVKAVYERGHTIGLHGYAHQPWISKEVVNDEVRKCKEALYDVLPDLTVEYYRPPYEQMFAEKYPKVLDVNPLRKMCAVDYTTSCNDWLTATTVNQMMFATIHHAKHGGTILLHDGYHVESECKDRAKVVQSILPIYMALSRRNFKFVTLKELENGAASLPERSIRHL